MKELRCNFCGKAQRQVKKLIAGPACYICDECVHLCMEIVLEDDKDYLDRKECEREEAKAKAIADAKMMWYETAYGNWIYQSMATKRPGGGSIIALKDGRFLCSLWAAQKTFNAVMISVEDSKKWMEERFTEETR